MDAPTPKGVVPDADVEMIRMQADEHPLIEDRPPATAVEHCLRLMHLRAYDEAVALSAGRDVLDVGCNTGYGTRRFLDVANRVVGVDVSPRAIEAALEGAAGGRGEFLLTSGQDLPFPDDSFDLVTSFQVLEHVPNAVAFLREIERVARPGAIVVLATPNAAVRLFPGMTPWNPFHVLEYTTEELRDVLETVFPEVRIRGMFGTPTLYETEIHRVDAVRRRARRLEDVAARQAAARARALDPTSVRPTGSWPVRVGRLLPASIRARLRAIARRVARVLDGHAATRATAASPVPANDPPSMDLETFLRFSEADLFYADTDLARAMDLLAICRVNEASPGA